MEGKKSYTVKYLGVVNGRVGVFSRRVVGKSPIMATNPLTSLKPNPMLEKLLMSRKLNDSPVKVLHMTKSPHNLLVENNPSQDLLETAPLPLHTEPAPPVKESSPQAIRTKLFESGTYKSEGSIYGSIEGEVEANAQKFMQQRFEHTEGNYKLRPFQLSSEIKLREINKELSKGSDNYFKSRVSSLGQTRQHFLAESPFLKRKMSFHHTSEQKQCHYVNLSLGAAFKQQHESESKKQSEQGTLATRAFERVPAHAHIMRIQSASAYQTPEDKGKKVSANLIRIRKTTAGPRTRQKLKKLSFQKAASQQDVTVTEPQRTSPFQNALQEILRHDSRQNYSNFLKTVYSNNNSQSYHSLTEEKKKNQLRKDIQRESLGFHRLNEPRLTFSKSPSPKVISGGKKNTSFLMSKYLTSSSFFQNEKPKTPFKLSTLTYTSNMKLVEPQLPPEREYQRIIKAYKAPLSRSTSPRPATPSHNAEITPYFHPIQNVIIPRPPNSSVAVERKIDSPPQLTTLGPSIENHSHHPETTTLTPVSNTSVGKREPIRIDFVKRRGEERKESHGGGTAITSVYEDINVSPRMEQRFDVKLQNKYVKSLRLRPKKQKTYNDTDISVIGVSMK